MDTDCSGVSKDLKDLKSPMWLSTHVTEVYVASPESPFWTGTGGDAIYGSCDGNVFVSMAVESVTYSYETSQYSFKRGLEAWKRGGGRIWYLPEYNGNSICYSPVKDTLLSFETNPARIEEIDAATGKPLRLIDKTEAGPIGGGRHSNYGGSRVCYDTKDHDKFWYADSEHHIVALADFSGKVYFQAGEYDIPGDDDTHFRNPKTVSNTATWGRILIGDTGNNRVVEYGVHMKLKEMFPFPEPYASYTVANQVIVHNGGNPQCHYGGFIFSDHLTCRPVNYIPFNTDSFIVHPHDPSIALIRWDDGLTREINIGNSVHTAPPTTARLFVGNEALKFTELISPPIPDYFRQNKSIWIRATKSGKVYYETAEFTARAAKWNRKWALIDTFSLTADKLLRITDPFPAGVCRVKVVLDDDGLVDGWVNIS